MRCTPSGIAWAKVLPPGTDLVRCLPAANGDIVAVGSATFSSDALIVRFDQNGGLIFAHVISTASNEVFTALAEGPTGSLYAGGTQLSMSGTELMIVEKLDAPGNVIWTGREELQTTGSSIGEIIVSNDSVFVFGTEIFAGNTDISLRVLNGTTGQEIMRRAFGHPSETDAAPRALRIPGGYVVSRTGSPGLSSSTGIFRLSSDAQLIAGGTSYGAPGIEVASVSLAVSGSDAYLAMQTATMGSGYAHVAKVSLMTFDMVWNSTMVANAYPVGLTVTGGIVEMASSQTAPIPFSGVVSSVPTSTGVLTNPCEGVPEIELTDTPLAITSFDPDIETWINIPVAQTAITGVTSHDFNVIPCAVPLPVELVSFAANAVNDRVELFWETATETGSSHFLVERSSDGMKWDVITRVEAAGESQALVTYRISDNTPLSGRSFYRLQSVDSDGSSEYSDVVMLERTGAHAYPNPAPTGSEISFSGMFEVYDLEGRLVASARDRIVLPRGMYLFRNDSGSAERVIVE